MRVTMREILFSLLVAAGCGARPTGNPGLMCSNALDFGIVALGSQGEQAITFSNASASPVQITSIAPATDPEFTLGVQAGQAIPAHGGLTAATTFKPFGDGARSATVSFATDSPLCPTVTVSMSGVGASLTLSVDPTTVDFGQVVVHSSPVQVVTVTNSSLLAVGVTPGAIAGEAASLFVVDQTAPFTVAPNSSTTIHVTYSPLVSSTEDTADFTLNLSQGSSVEIALRGMALLNGLRITPDPLDFGSFDPSTSGSLALTLANVGNEDIDVSSVAVVNPGSPAAFSIANGAWVSGTLRPGEELTVTVTFAPPRFGIYRGELDIASTDSNNVVPVSLRGVSGGAIQIDMFSGADHDLVLSAEPTPSSLQVFLDGPPPDATPAGQSSGAPLLASTPDGSANWTYQGASNSVLISATIPLQSSDSLYVEYQLAGP